MKITKVMKNAIAFFNIILIIALLCSCVGGDIHSATRLATPVVSINGEEVSWGTVSEADGYSIEEILFPLSVQNRIFYIIPF